MDSLLTDEWLAGADSIPILDEASVAAVRERVRAEAGAIGLSRVAAGSIVNVASELGHNQLAHAQRGRVAVRRTQRAGTPGIEVIAADGGPGIASPTDALKGRPPSLGTPRSSLGVGLAAALELADEIDFDVRIGEGTCVWARKFSASVPRQRKVGIYGRPCPGEDESGDHGAFVRSDGELLVGVADGLGHGPPAREASAAAIGVMRAGSAAGMERILEQCHEALVDTRGAVMALARIADPGDALRVSTVGNVTLQIAGPERSRRIAGPALVLGARGQRLRVLAEDHPLGIRDVLILFTDGISTQADLDTDLDLLREHPIVIAHQVVERFARNNDDALVAVVA
jgi:anti-sigma regulatory factor (Ser/Thr protein kinase)